MAAPSCEQTEHLLNYLEENRDLARGQLRSVEGRERSRRLWEQLTQDLNALGGAHKTTKQWLKVWADKKYLVKKAAAEAKRTIAGGGSPPANVFKDTDLKVLKIIGQQLHQPSIALTEHVYASPLSVSEEEQNDPEVEEISDVAQSPEPPRRQRRFTPTGARASHRGTRGDGLYRRLLRLEEKKVAVETIKTQEIRAIRQSLETLVGLVQEFVSSRE